MTDAEHAEVLRRYVEWKQTEAGLAPSFEAAIERAIELLSACPHCGGGGAHPGACRWCGKSR